MIVRYEPEKIELQLAAMMVQAFGALSVSSNGVFRELYVAPLPSMTEIETLSRGVVYRLEYEHGVVLLGAFELTKGTNLLFLRSLAIFWRDFNGLGYELNLRRRQILRLEELEGKALETYVRRLARTVTVCPRKKHSKPRRRP